MPKKIYNEEEKKQLATKLVAKINSKSCRILEYFNNSTKDFNELLDKAYGLRNFI